MPTSSPTRRLVLGATLAAAPVAAAAQRGRARPSAAARAADAIARALQAAEPTPALSVAVAGRSGLLWAQAYGKADLELDVAASPRHSFRLGSVIKVLTTTAAARLASRGVIDLDAPISRWLPELPEQHRRTTLKQLFTHQGGVRHYNLARDIAPTAPGGALDARIYPTNREILATFVSDPLVGPVGGQVAYSTFGYTLASLAMEAAAKQPFPDLIKAEVGRGWGLASLEEDDPMALKPLRASGYGPVRDYKAWYPRLTEGWVNARHNNVAYKWAGGGFVMSPGELALFGAAHLEGPGARITPAERALLFTPITAGDRNNPPLGLGWRVNRDASERLRWHHAGAQEGCRASLVVYPELGLSIALASNATGSPGDVLRPSSALADVFA
jgi:serine beta-lactamase-like protein LACTB, mitochondrial